MENPFQYPDFRLSFSLKNFLRRFKEDRIFRTSFLSALAAVLIFSGILFLFRAPGGFPEGTTFKIPEGSSLREVSSLLKQEDIIRSRLAFEAFAILRGGDRSVKEGYYFFGRKIPVFEVAGRIAKGKGNISAVKVTIPEGFTYLEMAERFAEKIPDFQIQKFIAEAEEKEGYLFPDTYFFFPGDNAQEALKHLENNYEKKIASLRPLFEEAGKTEAEIISMASIIEKEAEGDDDRNVISGILWKRISIGMALQADAAPETYERTGLPEKPIANPGLESIKAALEPTASPYLFYIHDKSGTIHYAETFAEHRKNILKYLK